MSEIKKDIFGNSYYVEDGEVFLVKGDQVEKVLPRRIFYDKDDNICIGIGLETCGRGSFATVERCCNEDSCIKIFDDPKIDYVDPYVIDVMMNEDIPGFYKIQSLFYKKSDDNTRIAGYMMKYLEKADMATFRSGGVDLLSKDSSYLVDSYEKLCEATLILSKKGILFSDLNDYNVSLEDDGIIIYDVDGFRKSDLPKEEIYTANMKMLNGLIVDLISNSLFDNHGDEVRVDRVGDYLESVRNCEGKFPFKDVFRSGEKAIDSLASYSPYRRR